jgi:hypothetical protein
LVLGPAHADTPVPKLKLNPSIGWRLEAVVRWEREKDILGDRKKDFDVIVIEGDVFNDSAQERAAPKVLIRTFDEDGREMYHWTVRTDEPRVKPRGRVPFSSRLASPPSDIVELEIKTVEAE